MGKYENKVFKAHQAVLGVPVRVGSLYQTLGQEIKVFRFRMRPQKYLLHHEVEVQMKIGRFGLDSIDFDVL